MVYACQSEGCKKKAKLLCECDSKVRLCNFHFIDHIGTEGLHKKIEISEVVRKNEVFKSGMFSRVKQLEDQVISEAKDYIDKVSARTQMLLSETHKIKSELFNLHIESSLEIELKFEKFQELLKNNPFNQILQSLSDLEIEQVQVQPKLKISSIDLVKTINETQSYPWVVLFSPSEKHVLVGFSSGIIKCLETMNQNLFFELRAHKDGVRTLKMTSDGSLLISGSRDFTIKVWDFSTQKLKFSLKEHTLEVRSLAISYDNQYLASASDDKKVKVWDFIGKKKEFDLLGHTQTVNSVAFSENKEWIISGSSDETIKIWKFSSRKLDFQLKADGPVFAVGFLKEQNFAFSGSGVSVCIWNLYDKTPEIRIKKHSECITSVILSPCGDYLISASHDKTIRLWGINDSEEAFCLLGHLNWIYSIDICGDSMASVSIDNSLKLWKISHLP